jgi:hypothetical protein
MFREKIEGYLKKNFMNKGSVSCILCSVPPVINPLPVQQAAVLRIRIRIHRIHMFLGLPDPDPLVRCMDPDPDPVLDPDPSIIMQK